MNLRIDDLVAAAEYARLDPVWWLEVVLGVTLHEHQIGLIERAHKSRKRKICWASCHSALKTYTLACYCLWFLFNHFPAKVITSAPTATQLEQVLWAEMRSLIRAAPIDLGGELLPKACELTISPEHYMVGLNASVPEAFQGRKSPHLLIVIDEASGFKDSFFEALTGNLASGDVTFLLASNPTRASGQVFNAFHGARNVWHCEQIDAFDTPNFVGLKEEFDHPDTTTERKLQLLRGARIRYKYLVSPHWAADILEEYGEDSDMFRVRVRGLFPKGDPNQLITLHDYMMAAQRWSNIDGMSNYDASEAAAKGKQFPWWRFRHLYGDMVAGGLDVARMGGASSVLSAQAKLISMPQITYPPSKTDQLEGFVASDVTRLGIHRLNVDEPGVGGGPCDHLPHLISGVIPFNGGKPAWQKSRFANLRSEMFWYLRFLFKKGLLAVAPCDKAMSQLTSILYSFLPLGERRVETKEEMEARGVIRMDHADSHMMSYARVPGAEAITTGKTLLGPDKALEEAFRDYKEEEDEW